MRLFIASLNNKSAITGDGGMCISFDDNLRVPSWFSYHEEYGIAKNWRSSFGLNSTEISETDIESVQIMSDYGHEFWNHTTNHPCDIDDYMLTHTAEEYYLQYVKPNSDLWVSRGLPEMTTFGYPCGNENAEVTAYLLSDNTPIKFVRGYLEGERPVRPFNPDMVGVFPYSANAQALGADKYHIPDYEAQDYIDLLAYCKENNLVMFLVGHWIGEEWGGAYFEKPLLNDLIDYCNANGMPQYLLNELNDL